MNRAAGNRPVRPVRPTAGRRNRSLPLAGHRVVVTRATEQAGRLGDALAAAGAEVAPLPLLEIVPPADPRPLQRAALEIALYDWVVFSSANAVEALLPLVGGELPQGVGVAAVGPATSEALRAWGVEPLVQPAGGGSRPGGAEGLLAELVPHIIGGGHRPRVLLPQAADALPTLARGLAASGAEAVAVVAYDKVLPRDAPRRAATMFSTFPLGWVTFTSPRIVRHFAELLAGDWEWRRCELLAASIGVVTSAELRLQGVEPAAQAAVPNDEGLVKAVIEAVTRPRPTAGTAGEAGSDTAGRSRQT